MRGLHNAVRSLQLRVLTWHSAEAHGFVPKLRCVVILLCQGLKSSFDMSVRLGATGESLAIESIVHVQSKHEIVLLFYPTIF